MCDGGDLVGATSGSQSNAYTVPVADEGVLVFREISRTESPSLMRAVDKPKERAEKH